MLTILEFVKKNLKGKKDKKKKTYSLSYKGILTSRNIMQIFVSPSMYETTHF